MKPAKSFYWHDYETWGIDPRRDRAVQFAGIRTDHDFNPIGQPLEILCKPSNDFLPHPQACLVTGITPQLAMDEGIPEADKTRFLAAGISAAMNTTIFGLMVAIPSLIIYTYLTNATTKIIDEMDEHLVKLINLITGNR